MRSSLRGISAIGWLIAISVLLAGIVLAFQFVRQTPATISTPISSTTISTPIPSTEFPSTASPNPEPQGYPAPTDWRTTPLPQGYPMPTPWPTTSAAESTALWATQSAEMTEHAPVIPTPIGTVMGPQTVQSMDGDFQLELLPGWRAYLGSTTLIMNYDDSRIGGEGDLPPGSLNIQIGVGKLPPEQSLDHWLTEWITVQMTNFQAPDQPTLASPIPQPYTLGSHQGITYNISAQPSFMQIILPVSDGRLIVIGLRPNDSPALPEALSMLSTLVVLPEKSQ